MRFQNHASIPPCSRPKVSQKWCPPTLDCWKINFDSAMYGEFDEASIEVVIRNSKGEVMAALSEKIKKSPTTDTLELLAAKQAMYSLEIGFTKFVFEGDSESMIKSLKYGGWEKTQGGHLIKDILAFVNSFQSISFSHVV